MGSWGMPQPQARTHLTAQQQPEQGGHPKQKRNAKSSESVAVSQTSRENTHTRPIPAYQGRPQNGARNVVRAQSNGSGSGVSQTARDSSSVSQQTSGSRPPSRPTPPVNAPRRPSYGNRKTEQQPNKSVTKLHPLHAHPNTTRHGTADGGSGGSSSRGRPIHAPPRSKTPTASYYRGRYPPTQQQNQHQRHRPPRARSQQGYRPGAPSPALIAGTNGKRPILKPKAAEAFA